MHNQIERIKKIRLFLLDSVRDLSVDRLNEVPAGFNNNIIWNLAHLIAAQQGVCYKRSGAAPVADQKYILPFTSGTKPEQYIDSNEVAIIKDLLLSSLDLFEADYQNNVFDNYVSLTTRYGVELTNIDEAVQFLMYHEGLHTGAVIALKRLVKK